MCYVSCGVILFLLLSYWDAGRGGLLSFASSMGSGGARRDLFGGDTRNMDNRKYDCVPQISRTGK